MCLAHEPRIPPTPASGRGCDHPRPRPRPRHDRLGADPRRGQPPVAPRQRPGEDQSPRPRCPSASPSSPATSKPCSPSTNPTAARSRKCSSTPTRSRRSKLGQARGVIIMLAARAGNPGRRICRPPGQEGRRRHRQCRKGAGPRDGPAPPPRRADRRPRRRRRARRGDHPRPPSGERRATQIRSG